MPIMLAAAAGSLDGTVFSAFHNVVVSAMTGNFVALGLGLGIGATVVPAACALAGYVLGLVTGTVTTAVAGRWMAQPTATGVALVLQLSVLAVFAVVWVIGGPTHAFAPHPMIAAAAVAMGVQGATMRRIGPAGTPTNFFTGAVTNWVSGIAEPGNRQWNPAAGARILVFVLAVGAGAALHNLAPVAAIALPLTLVGASAAVAVHAAHRARPATRLQLVEAPTRDRSDRRLVQSAA